MLDNCLINIKYHEGDSIIISGLGEMEMKCGRFNCSCYIHHNIGRTVTNKVFTVFSWHDLLLISETIMKSVQPKNVSQTSTEMTRFL